MYTSIGTLTVQAGKMDEAIRLWKQALEIAKRAKGFKTAKLLTDKKTNKCVIIGE